MVVSSKMSLHTGSVKQFLQSTEAMDSLATNGDIILVST